MASVKNLKKDINNVLGDVISECYEWELTNPEAVTKKTDAIVDEAVACFDDLIEKMHSKNVENKKAHFSAIKNELAAKATSLLNQVNKLG
ncbi:hypothetical protein KH5_24390 [Urechidicola sp. KH5]